MDDVEAIAEQAIKQADEMRELQCRIADDHQTHVQRALESHLPARLANKMVDIAAMYLQRATEGAQQWNETHHRDGVSAPQTNNAESATKDETPSPRGTSSRIGRVLTHPLTVAAVTAGTVYGATQLLKSDPPAQDPDSVYQYLEDGGYHVAPRANE